MGLIGKLTGVLGGVDTKKVKPVEDISADPGARAIEAQLQAQAQQSQRSAQAIAAGSNNPLALVHAQNVGRMARSDAANQAAQQRAALEQQVMMANQGAQLQAQELEQQRRAANAAARSRVTGALIQGGATMGGSAILANAPQQRPVPSDERGKEGIRSGVEDARAFLDSLSATTEPKSFKRKPEVAALVGDDTDRQVGVMAQDVEKAGPVGKSMVEESPAGKVIDTGKEQSMLLAALADLNKRLTSTETALADSLRGGGRG